MNHTLIIGPPSIDEYLRLRAVSGLSERTREQAGPAVANSWFFCHVRDESGVAVAMGRVIGDGGWYFHIADVATDPAHQRQGLGRLILDTLLAHIRDEAPPGAYVSLIADPPGVRLYERVGLRNTAPSIGMAMRLAAP